MTGAIVEAKAQARLLLREEWPYLGVTRPSQFDRSGLRLSHHLHAIPHWSSLLYLGRRPDSA